jgi:hypothetical protein
MSADTTTIPIVLLEQIGISAAVSGAISAVVNYLLTMRQNRREREIAVVQEKLNLYAIFIYHVDKLIHIGGEPFQRERDPALEKELKAIFGSLESSINNKYHLLKYDEILRIGDIRKLYEDPNTAWEKVEEELKQLYGMLYTEFNDTIPKYERIVAKGIVRPIQHDKHETSTHAKA